MVINKQTRVRYDKNFNMIKFFGKVKQIKILLYLYGCINEIQKPKKPQIEL